MIDTGGTSKTYECDAGGAANGNALGTVVAGPAQAVSTDVRGILYHNGGPGSDLVPARDCGASGGNVVSAANFIINPSMEDLFNDEAHPNPTNIRICALGAMAAVSGGAAGVNGDTLLIADSDQNTNAVASVQFDGVGLAGIQGTGGAGSGGMPVGGQMVIRGADGTVLLTIEAQANSGVGTGFDATLRPNNWTLSATTYADTQVGATGNGVNYWVFPRGNANANKIYVVAHDHANGGTAYPAGAGVNQAMAAFAQTVANAVSHWADTHGGKIRAAQNDATGAGNLPHNGARVDFTMRLHKGTEGNAPGGVAAEGFNTITAYNSSGQPIQAGATANTWFGNAAGNAFPTFVGFAGGADATLAQIAQDARLTATTTAQLNTDLLVPIEDLPVRVSYFTDDGCREATAPAGGVGGAVIDVNALVDDGANDLRLTFTVPAAMGGFAANGGVTQIRFDESATNGNALDDANAMAIGSNGLTAAALAADIADAINGLAAGNAQVNAATSGNGSVATGVAGVTATVVGTEVHCVLDGAGATSAGVADCSVVSTRNDGTTEIGAVSVNFSPTGDAARGAGWAVIWGPE